MEPVCDGKGLYGCKRIKHLADNIKLEEFLEPNELERYDCCSGHNSSMFTKLLFEAKARSMKLSELFHVRTLIFGGWKKEAIVEELWLRDLIEKPKKQMVGKFGTGPDLKPEIGLHRCGCMFQNASRRPCAVCVHLNGPGGIGRQQLTETEKQAVLDNWPKELSDVKLQFDQQNFCLLEF